MARLNVNPTRMELQNLKKRLTTAKKGHRLLKNKSDEMIRQFMILNNQNKVLRQTVEAELSQTLKLFMIAKSKEDNQKIEQLFSMINSYRINTSLVNIMGLNVPKMQMEKNLNDMSSLPNSLLSVNSRLDKAILTLSSLLEKIVNLAQVEKTCEMLAEEIEKNKRRINALEYILIPQIEETTKFIVMKLDENERNNLIRLMKVKEKMTNENELSL